MPEPCPEKAPEGSYAELYDQEGLEPGEFSWRLMDADEVTVLCRQHAFRDTGAAMSVINEVYPGVEIRDVRGG